MLNYKRVSAAFDVLKAIIRPTSKLNTPCALDCYTVCWPLTVSLHSPNDRQMPVASFPKEVNQRLAKRPLETNGRLAYGGVTSVVKDTTAVWAVQGDC